MSLNIIPKPADDRVLKDSSDYTNDIKHDHDKIPLDENGNLISGGLNFSATGRDKNCREMDALLSKNRNSRARPLQHLVFSYEDKSRIPSHKQIRRHIRRYLKNVGMSDHMCLYDAHDNTDHFHVHVLLCRLAHEPDENGVYKIADNGLFKTPNEKGVLRTNEAVCRQATIAQVCRDEGWPPPNLKYDTGGKPVPGHQKKDRPGRDGIPSKSDQLAAIGWEVFQTSKERREPVERLLELGIKVQLVQKAGKIVGAKLVANDGTSCGFAKMDPNKKGLFKLLAKQFALASEDEYADPDRVSPFQAEDQLRALMRPIFAEPARFGDNWDYLIEAIGGHDAHIERSGGGLIVVLNGVKVTTSSIGNRYSLSKLEKSLGPCPLPKSAPAQPSKRDLVIQDAEPILSHHVRLGGSLVELRDALAHADISIEKKVFTNADGRRVPYFTLARDGVSVTLSQISKDADGRATYSLPMLERLDRAAKRAAEVHNWLHRSPDNGFEERYFRYLDNFITNARKAKEKEVGMLTLFAAVAKFIKTKGVTHVHANSSEVNQQEPGCGEAPRA